jgi:hypothetical protein
MIPAAIFLVCLLAGQTVLIAVAGRRAVEAVEENPLRGRDWLLGWKYERVQYGGTRVVLLAKPGCRALPLWTE